MATNIMVVKGGTLKLGPSATAVSVECQMSNVVISATPDPKEFTAMCGKITVPGVTSYVLNLEGAQDWAAAGISTYLWENDGDLVDFDFAPTAAADPSANGQCYIVPGDFGGQAGEIATFSVSLGINGKPTITSGVVTAAARQGDEVDDLVDA